MKAHKETVPHRHPINIKHHEERTFAERVSDSMRVWIGSWRFIIIQSCILITWIILNSVLPGWDRYPFILLNLTLSFQAAYTGPILLNSENRSAERDRLLLEHQAEVSDTQQQLLEENTALTREIHQLTMEIRSLTAENTTP